jgi:hypothetical protein
MRRMTLHAALAAAVMLAAGCAPSPPETEAEPAPACNAWLVTVRNTMEYTLMIGADGQEAEARSGQAVTFLVKRPHEPRVTYRCLSPRPSTAENRRRCGDELADHLRMRLFEETVVCTDPGLEAPARSLR